jgi:hypothetical protein
MLTRQFLLLDFRLLLMMKCQFMLQEGRVWLTFSRNILFYNCGASHADSSISIARVADVTNAEISGYFSRVTGGAHADMQYSVNIIIFVTHADTSVSVANVTCATHAELSGYVARLMRVTRGVTLFSVTIMIDAAHVDKSVSVARVTCVARADV